MPAPGVTPGGDADPRGVEDGDRSRITLAEIADRASVSISSVSKVLNGRPGISPTNRRRIEALLQEYGYSPRGPAPFAKVIEVVFYELDTEWMIEVLMGVESVAQERGCRIMLTPSQDLQNPARGWIDEVVQRRPAGVILLFSGPTADQVAQLRSRSIPFVVVDPAGDPEPGMPYVGSQNWSGGLAATEHLIGLGHRRIAVITGREDQLFARARLAGYVSAMHGAGLELRDEYVRHGSFHVEDGVQQGRALLALPEPPTAIFAGSDLQALGVYEAASERGLQIPEDLSIVGYDDLRLARWSGPPLTTVHQPVRDMAMTATRIVLEPNLRGQSRVDLAIRLIVRQSTAAPNPNA